MPADEPTADPESGVRVRFAALRALRNKTLHRVNWNNTFFRYVARDISDATMPVGTAMMA